MITAFQPAAFQVAGFQIEAVIPGGYGFGAYDPKRRRDEEREELAREIAALEAHLAGKVPAEIVPREELEPDGEAARLRTLVHRTRTAELPNRARRAVEYARRAQTLESFRLAERALRRLEEQEEFAVLLALALD